MQLLSHSPDETEAAGARLAETLGPGAVVVFTGDLERYENCEIILNMISLTTNVKFEVKDREIIVE